eukprot:m.5785 g.5785  ORF g.5785 m.5785 type:complete len:562 (+) comp14109_c0_seq1:124-1809(+)
MKIWAWLTPLFLSSYIGSTAAQSGSNMDAMDAIRWQRLAIRSQSYLTRHNSVASNLYCGTYNSAISLHYSSLRMEAIFGNDDTGMSKRNYCPREGQQGKCFSATGSFTLFDQVKSIEEQLSDGVRRFNFPLVRVGVLTPELRVCKPVPDICRTLKSELNLMDLYDYSWDVDICDEFLGLKDYEEYTGCTEDSLTWTDMLKKIKDFLSRSVNGREIVILEVDTTVMEQRFGCSAQPIVEDPIRDILGDLVFTPADLNTFTAKNSQDEFAFTVDWPSSTYLQGRGRQVILMAPCKYSGNWFHHSKDFRKFDETTSAQKFVSQRCGTTTSSGFVAALSKLFTGIYEDRTNFEIDIVGDDGTTQGAVYLANGQSTGGILDRQEVSSVVDCGYSPLFSRMKANRVSECVWTWARGNSSLCGDGLCTAFKIITGRGSVRSYEWVNVDCELSLPTACRNEHISTDWDFGPNVAFPKEAGVDLDDRNADYCPDFYVYDIPKSPDDASGLVKSMGDYRIDMAWIKYTHPVTCHRDSSLNPPLDLYEVDSALRATGLIFTSFIMSLISVLI